MKKFLEVGDIIQLENGMTVYAAIPEKFLHHDAPFSEERLECPIEIGKVYRKSVPDKERFVEQLWLGIRKKLLGADVKREAVASFVDSLGLNFSPEEFNSSGLAGVYRVYKSSYNGLLVCCEKIDNPEIRVHFSQRVGVLPTSLDIKPIRHED